MIDTYLQDAIVEEVKTALSGYRQPGANGTFVEINVYPQYLPVKKQKNDPDQYPYVLVCYDEENIQSEDSTLDTNIYMLIGIKNDDLSRQGYKDVFVIKNLIYQHFLRKRTIAEKYSLKFPYKFTVQQEDTHPFYLGGIEMTWELPVMQKEDKYT